MRLEGAACEQASGDRGDEARIRRARIMPGRAGEGLSRGGLSGRVALGFAKINLAKCVGRIGSG